MKTSGPVKSSKAQLKIQQMAFMLVGLAIFFSMVALVYFSISYSGLKKTAENLEETEAMEIVRKLASSPELAFTSASDCPNCVDFDKAYMLKSVDAYKRFWNIDYLMVEKIYPVSTNDECVEPFYPDCSKITIASSNNFGSASSAYVTIVSWDNSIDNFRYELGRVHASGGIQRV